MSSDKQETRSADARGTTWYMLVIVKFCIVFGFAVLLNSYLGTYTRFAYGIGLVLGGIAQHIIPPRAKTRDFALFLALTCGYGILRGIWR